MPDFLANLLKADFLAHGHCYRWQPEVVWLHVVSDLLIALAYYFIPFALIYIVRKRGDLAYPWMFWLFGIFILACGTTHLMSVWTVWQPVYRLDGVVKLVTALASVPTAILLIRLAPAVIALPSPEQLRIANSDLEAEVMSRKEAERQVRELNAELEDRVRLRTQELEVANQHLRESEDRLHSILDSSPTLVFLRTTDGQLQFVNKRLQQLIGNRDAEAGNADIPETLLRDDKDVIETRNPVETEEVVYEDAEPHTYLSLRFPLYDETNQIYAVCNISRDITERKKAEQTLRDYNAELEQFAFVAAHDLQEPLRTVKTYTQLLTRKFPGEAGSDTREFVDYITSGVDRMTMLISDLQAYSEVAYRRVPQFEPIDLNTVVQDTVKHLEASIREAGAEIELSPLPAVFGSGPQLGRLFQNLISNAIKYRREEPLRIQIGARRMGREWEITVKDNGIGLDMQYATQIFGVFRRLHGREIPGTGIGLAICRKIVERHGGRIWVESDPGLGSQFFFTLPRVH